MNRARTSVLSLLLLAVLLPACQTSPPRGSWRIVPRDPSGALGKNSGSEEELRKAYGKENVVSGSVDLGEGTFTPGTILFPGGSVRRVAVVWEDPVQHRIPARVFLRGDRSLWKLPGDVTLGMSL